MLVQLSRGYVAIVSVEDAKAVSEFNWQVNKRDTHRTEYAQRNYVNDRGVKTTVSLHRFVGSLMGLSLTAEVDHKNRNGLDCRRSNLRDASRSQNLKNRAASALNTTGFVGVHKQKDRFIASLSSDKMRHYLGSFVTIEDAARAVGEARARLHGDFAFPGVLVDEAPKDPGAAT